MHLINVLSLSEMEGWVPDILRLLAVSKTGLTSDEIFHMLGMLGYTGSHTVKNFDWLQFQICLGNMVYEGAEGHIKYSHQHMQDIVEYVLLRKLSISECTSMDLIFFV